MSTWCFIVLERDHELWSFLETLQEVDDEVPDVLGVRALEGELLAAHRHQGERLGERLRAPKNSLC